MTLTFAVPMPPTLTNGAHGRSRHWRAVEREKHAYWVTLDILQGLPIRQNAGIPWGIPHPPATPLPAVLLSSHMVLGGAMDDDNAVARHKWLVDWLVRRGYLASDRRTCVRWAAFPEQTITRRHEPTIHLTITVRTDR